MTDLGAMLKQQMQNTLTSQLDSAVQAGDIQAARKATQQIAELATATAPRPVKGPPTTEEIKKALSAKASWFGIDPRKSAKAAELGKMMLPERFETAEAFADALLKEIEKDEAAAAKDPDEENDEEEEDDTTDTKDNAEDEEVLRTKTKRRNGTAAPELSAGNRTVAGSNLRRAFDTGDIKHLPKPAADEIKKLADKFARNGTKEQRAAYISSAVKARARGDLIAAGKYDAKDNKFK